jgi:two-component system chemotaxis response regulator CheB
VITESEASAVVYGMPRAVSEAGLSDATASLEDLVPLILARL